jgi:hypothetical protein
VGQSGLPGYVMTETSVDVLNLSLGVTLGEAVLSLMGVIWTVKLTGLRIPYFLMGRSVTNEAPLRLGCPGRDFVFLFRRRLIICSPLNRVFIPRRIWKK